MPASPLRPLHEELGARFVDFSGWEMPVRYQGVLAEHTAVRQGAGIFDVSHLGRISVAGEGSTRLLRALLCNDVARVDPGRAQYTMLLDRSGGVLDDIIVWRWEEEAYWVLPNAGNQDRILDILAEGATSSVEVTSLREETVLLAVQGPEAPALLERVLGTRPERFRLGRARFQDTDIRLAGTGYTGEAGGEVVAPIGPAPALFRAILEAGALPCGLGSRDTLRLEMGYPLWGQDLDPRTTPLEAGLGWVVAWDHEFVGREALERQRAEGPPKALVGFVMEGREIARHGYPLRAGESRGHVTSGNYSPVLGRGIGLGYLAPAPAEDLDQMEVEVRSRWVTASRTTPPFVEE